MNLCENICFMPWGWCLNSFHKDISSFTLFQSIFQGIIFGCHFHIINLKKYLIPSNVKVVPIEICQYILQFTNKLFIYFNNVENMLIIAIYIVTIYIVFWSPKVMFIHMFKWGQRRSHDLWICMITWKHKKVTSSSSSSRCQGRDFNRVLQLFCTLRTTHIASLFDWRKSF